MYSGACMGAVSETSHYPLSAKRERGFDRHGFGVTVENSFPSAAADIRAGARGARLASMIFEPIRRASRGHLPTSTRPSAWYARVSGRAWGPSLELELLFADWATRLLLGSSR